MAKDIRIIEVRSEIGAGTRGASLGVDAIQIAALDLMSDFFNRFPVKTIETENQLLFQPVESPLAKRITGVITLYERVSNLLSATLQSNGFPVVLAGDHSTAGGTIAGIRMAYPDARLGVIWMDAHADLHTPYTTPSGNLHGMPVAVAIGEDNLDCRVHTPDRQTVANWEKLKRIGDYRPKLLPGDVVYIALRDYEKEEASLIRTYDLKVVTTSEIREKGATCVAHRVLDWLGHCDLLYLSFDVDSLDPTVSKGTGTPAEHGLWESEARDLIVHFMKDRRMCCFEIAEVNPTLDTENKMAETAFNILRESINPLRD